MNVSRNTAGEPESINDKALAKLFHDARSYPTWQERPVSDYTLHALYDLVKWGPTSMNCQPMRLVFVKSAEAREKLVETLSAGNVKKVQAAPVTAIVAYDLRFFDQLKTQWPHSKDAGATYEDKPELAEKTAFRNGTLQGGYLILAARALGLDAGPMSGFSNKKVDEAFFADTTIRSNFIMNLGYGDPSGLHSRGPRLDFEQAARIV